MVQRHAGRAVSAAIVGRSPKRRECDPPFVRSRLPASSGSLRVCAEPTDETDVGGMDVEDPKVAIADVPKAVKNPNRCGNPCSRATSDDVIAKPKFSFSFKHIEGIGVIRVGVRVNAESGAKARIDDFELRQLDEYPVATRTTGDLLSLAGRNADAGHRRSISHVAPVLLRPPVRSTTSGLIPTVRLPIPSGVAAVAGLVAKSRATARAERPLTSKAAAGDQRCSSIRGAVSPEARRLSLSRLKALARARRIG